MEFPEGHLNLFLTEIGEPSENSLRIVVGEGLLGAPAPVEEAGIGFGEGRLLGATDESRSFELNWDSYVAYVVRNESFWAAEPGEPPFEKHLTRRFDSAFLRFVSVTTFADDNYPGPLQHWALITHHHCIDVVSVQPPGISPIKPSFGEEAPTRSRREKG